MDHQDWKPVVLHVKPKTKQDAVRDGKTVTVKKASSSSSSSTVSLSIQKAADAAGDTSEMPEIPKVSLELGTRIQQARLKKKMTQKELANKISELVSVVNDYENRKGTPNPNILRKMETALGVKLLGKNLAPI